MRRPSFVCPGCMKLSDTLLIALNAFLMAFAFIGFASDDKDTLMVGAMLAMVTALTNGVAIYRRRVREPKPVARAERASHPVDEMDARTILDLDARMEALEQAQADAVRWRELADSGQATGPAAPVDGNGPMESVRTRSQA